MLAYTFLFLLAVALATIVFLLQNANKSGSCEDGLNEENMLVVLRDLIFAGADTRYNECNGRVRPAIHGTSSTSSRESSGRDSRNYWTGQGPILRGSRAVMTTPTGTA